MTSAAPTVRHHFEPAFLQIPDDAQSEVGLMPDAMDVAVGVDDRLYVLSKKPPKVFVFEPTGEFVTSFGDGMFCPRPHCIAVGNDGTIWIADSENHVIRHFSADGKHLGDIGTFGVPSDTGIDLSAGPFKYLTIKRVGAPFHDPNCVAVAPNGDLFVGDGDGNAAIHHFSADGKLITSWGGPGSYPGRFCEPHGITIHNDEVVVCDRGNERLQFFGFDGAFHRQYLVQRPAQVAFDADGNALVVSMGWNTGELSYGRGVIVSEMSPCLSILDTEGRLVERVGGDGMPWEPDTLTAAHGIAIDSKGTIYVADITSSMRIAATLTVEERLARTDTVRRWAQVPVPRDIEISPCVLVLKSDS